MNFSKALQEKLRKDGSMSTVMNYIQDITWFSTLVKYAINWKYRATRVELYKWYKDQELPELFKEELDALKLRNIGKSDDALALSVLRLVARKINYIGDSKIWKVPEYWQTVEETLYLRTGDCEDGAVLIGKSLAYVGIEEYKYKIVAGDVEGGGHCWVEYISDNGFTYPLDWCYWVNESKKMKYPTFTRQDYYHGERIWFGFNNDAGFKINDI